MRDRKTILHATALGIGVSMAAFANHGAVSKAVAQVPEDSWIPWCEHDDGNGGTECHYYRLTGIEDFWQDAEDQAVAAGGHLVTINDSAENQFVFSTFCPDLLPEHHAWIGLIQDTTDPGCSPNCEPDLAWDWISGKKPLIYTNWGGGEPNDLGGATDRGEMSCSSGAWNDTRNPFAAPQPGIIERQLLDGKIPAVSEWGLVAMALLIAVAGTVALMKRHRQTA